MSTFLPTRMPAPTPFLEVLPPDLISQIVTVLYALRSRSSFNAAMQTCKAMRTVCSGFITKFADLDKDNMDASSRAVEVMIQRLNRFPR